MTAQGKINASRVTVGDRILVLVGVGTTTFSSTKTGDGVAVARVTGKTLSPMAYSSRRTYTIHTTAGDLVGLQGIQTMWLAPEDAAGIKRAHVEALKLDRERDDRRFLKAAAALATDPAVRQEAQDLLDAKDAAALEVLEPVGPAQEELEEMEPVARALVELKVPTPAPSRDQLLAYSQSLPAVEMAYSSLAAGVRVAALAGPCQPTAEDLSDLALALVAEDLETLEPEEVRVPATHRVVPGDVVRIHRGVRLYEVLKVEEDRARNNLTRDVVDMTMARVAPCDPEDGRDAQWVHVDLLHVVPPVARVQSRPISHGVSIVEDVVVVVGSGWDPEREMVRRVALIRVDGTRVMAILRTMVPHRSIRPVACLRIGDAIVVDGRCYRVVWHGGPAEPVLEPARWRDRLPA